MKHLASGDIVKEVDKDTYVPNETTALMCLPAAQGMHINMFESQPLPYQDVC
jgi:hypothetical protein